MGRRRGGFEKSFRTQARERLAVEAARDERRRAAAEAKRAARLAAIEAKRQANRRPERVTRREVGSVVRPSRQVLVLALVGALLFAISGGLAASGAGLAAALVGVVGGVVFLLGSRTATRARRAGGRVEEGDANAKLRVADPSPEAVEPPVLACAECGEEIAEAADAASCALCTDVLHDGACADRHAARHEGNAGGRAYR